jgi:hypothetical protein
MELLDFTVLGHGDILSLCYEGPPTLPTMMVTSGDSVTTGVSVCGSVVHGSVVNGSVVDGSVVGTSGLGTTLGLTRHPAMMNATSAVTPTHRRQFTAPPR